MSLRIYKKYRRWFFRYFSWLDNPTVQKTGRIILTVLLLLTMLLVFVSPASAQVSSSNPGEWAAFEAGNIQINKAVKSTTEEKIKTNGYMALINGELTQIDGWEDKYMSYLETVQGFASTMKSSSMIVADGVKIYMSLNKLTKAVRANPSGLVATAALNDTYMEAVSEFITIYYLLEYVVAKGGKKNLLDGTARCTLLWSLEDKMSNFSKKLNKLVISVSCKNMSDVWFQATAGMLVNDRPSLIRNASRQALGSWKRTGVNTWKINH